MDRPEYIGVFLTELQSLNFYPIPCTKWEINSLEKDLTANLPKAFKEFLQFSGRAAGKFMSGSLFFYGALGSVQDAAADFLRENNLPPLPGNAFVFFCHQGYIIAYFIIGEGDDPPVYIMSECGTGIREAKTESFTKFLMDELSAYQVMRR